MRKKFLYIILFFIISVLLIVDFSIDKSEAHFKIEKYFAFFSLIGFLSTFIYIFFSKYILKKIVSRKEEYYDK